MLVGLSLSVCGLVKGRMAKGYELIVYNGIKATDKNDAFLIVQLPYLIRREQLTAAMSSDELRFLSDFYWKRQRPPLPQWERGPCLIRFSW